MFLYEERNSLYDKRNSLYGEAMSFEANGHSNEIKGCPFAIKGLPDPEMKFLLPQRDVRLGRTDGFCHKRDAERSRINSLRHKGTSLYRKGNSVQHSWVPFTTNGHYLKERAIPMETDRVRDATGLIAVAASRVSNPSFLHADGSGKRCAIPNRIRFTDFPTTSKVQRDRFSEKAESAELNMSPR